MKKKNIRMSISSKKMLTALVILNIASMFLDWFGKDKEMFSMSGFMVLSNPLTILFFLMILWGTWYEFKNKINNKLIYLGILGILFMEFWYFLTWYVFGHYEYIDFFASFDLVFLEYYVGVGITLIMLIMSIIFLKK